MLFHLYVFLVIILTGSRSNGHVDYNAFWHSHTFADIQFPPLQISSDRSPGRRNRQSLRPAPPLEADEPETRTFSEAIDNTQPPPYLGSSEKKSNQPAASPKATRTRTISFSDIGILLSINKFRLGWKYQVIYWTELGLLSFVLGNAIP